MGKYHCVVPAEFLSALESRVAWRAGYSDGYHGYPMDPSDWRIGYGDGYEQGKTDRASPDT